MDSMTQAQRSEIFRFSVYANTGQDIDPYAPAEATQHIIMEDELASALAQYRLNRKNFPHYESRIRVNIMNPYTLASILPMRIPGAQL